MKVDSHIYPYSLEEMKTKVLAAFNTKTGFDAPLIIKSGMNMQREEEVYKVFKEEGFTYKNKIYLPKELEFGFSDLMGSDQTARAKKKISDSIFKADIHTLLDQKDKVVIADGSLVYTLLKSGKGTKLEVRRVNSIVRGPIRGSINWFGLLSGNFPLSFQKGVIYLEDSMKKKSHPELYSELEMIYIIQPDVAKKWEEDFTEEK